MDKARKAMATIDGNEAAATIAHKLSEVIAIYPITPSSTMGEMSDEWSSKGRKNLWGTVPLVQEMQSEGGAAAAVHGAIQIGAMTTTFTASQGLLLMIPTMYKIAGELSPTVFHVSARSLACQALSIFGDHSDVMAVRQTGFALLASNSVQEAMDMALIAHVSTLKSRIPFLHFFDGFRTSSEVQKIELVADETIRAMIDDELVVAFRNRAMSPEKPVLRGTSQNPDVYFQGRETVNPYYLATPAIVREAMGKFAELTGRAYSLFDYVGAPDAERVLVQMCSGAEVAHETVESMVAGGEKVGLLKVRLYRPFDSAAFAAALPGTAKTVAVLDRTKEPGSPGEPLYLDVVNALAEAGRGGIRVIGGRYGLGSKEFTPGMAAAVLNEAGKPKPANHFTVGIEDDVTGTSLRVDRDFCLETPGVHQAVFLGLGSDGTVGANKNSIKIIGEETDYYAQGYFVYDSKKAGTLTVSHLRFGPKPIRQTCLVSQAAFVGCHQSVFMEQYDVLAYAAQGATFLLNSPYGPGEVWDHLPMSAQKQMLDRKIRLFVIDAYKVAHNNEMGVRINTIMQTCFFAISGILPREEAIEKIKQAIRKSYGRKGEDVVRKNFEAVDDTLANLHEVKYPAKITAQHDIADPVSAEAPEFVRTVTSAIISKKGDALPVSAIPADGTWPTSTTRWEKRNIALEVPVWDPAACLQCAVCSLVCPHAAVRVKIYDPSLLEGAPEGFRNVDAKGSEFPGTKWTVQVAPEDCTGCGACVHSCPGKNRQQPGRKAINMTSHADVVERERVFFDYFLSIPECDREKLNRETVKGSQLLRPLFEFSGACAGCGETAYVKLMTQLFGDRAVVANATGCSSIYGGNLPTTPYCVNADGRGPAWNNSLFEDAAEFGFGFRLTVDRQTQFAAELMKELEPSIGSALVGAILGNPQKTEPEIAVQRKSLAELQKVLSGIDSPRALQLRSLMNFLQRRSVWIIGGDGWAYDIGYGGLDHVIAQGRNVNILILDTEVYSNTGGQCSKATPLGAVARFAASGKPLPKKDMAMLAMAYGNVYVAKVALGANYAQTVKAFVEAESWDGPSMIIAYSHCINHGIDMTTGLDHHKLAVNSGYWPLLRFDPRRTASGQNPLQLDSKAPSIQFRDFAYEEIRFRTLADTMPEHAAELLRLAQEEVTRRWSIYEQMAAMKY
jgi:pyruvate-ferredoxin/flavodoxin oxidoreductase